MNKTSKILKVVGLCVVAALFVALASLFVWMTVSRGSYITLSAEQSETLAAVEDTIDDGLNAKSQLTGLMTLSEETADIKAKADNLVTDYKQVLKDLEEVKNTLGIESDKYAELSIKAENLAETIKAYHEYVESIEKWVAKCPLSIDEENGRLRGDLYDVYEWLEAKPTVPHFCDSVCDECHFCTNSECIEYLCENKCEGHEDIAGTDNGDDNQ